MNIFLLQFLLEIVFLTIVFLHITKKDFGITLAYSIQSLAIVLILLSSFLKTGSMSLLFVTLLTLIAKVILAPVFFARLIKKHKFIFSTSAYLNIPLTLIIITILTFIAHSQKFTTLTSIIPANQAVLSLALSTMLLSLFLIVNRKGAISQTIGILSLENSIVAFAIFAGLEQSATLQIGIIFDICIWFIIAIIFMSMLYKHFGSLNVTSMKHLKE